MSSESIEGTEKVRALLIVSLAEAWKDEQKKQEVRAFIEKAEARSGLITVLTRRLESSDDLLAKIAAAELRNDPNWHTFTRGIVRYHRKRRKIQRKRKR